MGLSQSSSSLRTVGALLSRGREMVQGNHWVAHVLVGANMISQHKGKAALLFLLLRLNWHLYTQESYFIYSVHIHKYINPYIKMLIVVLEQDGTNYKF